jgi:Ca2+-binding EF-hand superfamily protein
MKDIFISLDEDESGTMDQDELVKALLSLGLSQDIVFAKRIVNILKENKLKQNKSNYLEYTFKDFQYLFKEDTYGDKILNLINKEMSNRKIDKKIKKRK